MHAVATSTGAHGSPFARRGQTLNLCAIVLAPFWPEQEFCVCSFRRKAIPAHTCHLQFIFQSFLSHAECFLFRLGGSFIGEVVSPDL